MARKATKNAKKSGSKKRSQETAEASNPTAEDPMSQAVGFCQSQEWRQALIIFKKMCAKAIADDNTELLESLTVAQQKVEYSLRRQMAASLVDSVKDLLAKEYLLDVGE